MAKTSFNECLLAVAPEHRVFVEKLNDKLLEQQLRKLTAEANATEAKAKILTDSANKLEGNIKNNEMLRALVEVPIIERKEGDL